MTINAMADSSCMKLQFATVVCNGHSSIWPSAERCVVYIAVYIINTNTLSLKQLIIIEQGKYLKLHLYML